MRPVLLDDAVCDPPEGGPSPQLTNGVHELGVKGWSQHAPVTLLHRQTVDLPSAKLPENVTTCLSETESSPLVDMHL